MFVLLNIMYNLYDVLIKCISKKSTKQEDTSAAELDFFKKQKPMFENEFYPTPPDVIKKMLTPYYGRMHQMQILEPSAGNGAILDYLSEDYRVKKKNLYAIEINKELVFILQGKGYRIIAEDFLTYRPLHSFDLIVMNPPFSNGDEHLLHAWEITHTGDIVCLLNAETIRNPYTQRRQLLKKIVDTHGSVEFLGRCFRDSIRKTDVEVAMVRLHKEEVDNRWSIEFGEGARIDSCPNFYETASSSSEIALNDQIGGYIRSWQKAQEAAIDFIKARKRLEFYLSPFMPIEKAEEDIRTGMEESGSMQGAYNSFLNSAKSAAWMKLGVEKYMTANLRKTFAQFCQAQGAYEINRENIHRLIQFVCLNTQNIMKQAVVDVYDTFCLFYKDNAVHKEGWKTNARFRVNKKVILPGFVSAGYNWQKFGCSKYFRVQYDRHSEYRDIDKVMCYLSGIPFESLNKLKRSCEGIKGAEMYPDSYEYLGLEKAISFVEVGDKGVHESAFFNFKCYKKGTLHIEFKDENLWERFNLFVNEGKMELGYSEGK